MLRQTEDLFIYNSDGLVDRLNQIRVIPWASGLSISSAERHAMQVWPPGFDPVMTRKSLSRFMCTSACWNNFVILPMSPGARHLGIYEEVVIEHALLSLAQYFGIKLLVRRSHPPHRLAVAHSHS